MKCKKVKVLLAPYILGDLVNDFKLLGQLEEHLRNCNYCTEEYQSIRQTIGFVEEYKDIFAEVFAEIDLERARKADTQKRSWEKIPSESTEKTKSLQLFRRISAVAACLLIGISLWMVFSNQPKPQTPPQNSSLEQVVSAIAPSVEIEVVSDDGNIIIPAGRNISTLAGQLMTLRINEKHRLIVNENTSLSINPLVLDENIGCAVELTTGRIYAYVEHNGNPFVVETSNGNAVITGTTFDIQTTGIETKLVVVEGTVQFKSQAGSVKVSKGQFSKIVTRSGPTVPLICDTFELTAWARGYELKNTLAKIESITDSFDLTDLWLTAASGTIELENLNYQEWIEQKQDWFEREFSQVFRLKEALAEEAIEVDYPELLFATGDIWQFAYPQVSNQQIPVISFDSLLKAGSQYGFDEQWLLENIPAKSFPDNPKEIFTGRNALEQWADCFEQLQKSSQAPDSGTLLYSLHAGTYLTNTRTLAWLYIANEKPSISDEDKGQVQALLQSQVNTANELTNLVIRLFAASKNQPCEELNTLINQIIGSITAIMDIEEGISEYEISK
ncbi:FecR domain-containing protein [Planctomycetota bacterium]